MGFLLRGEDVGVGVGKSEWFGSVLSAKGATALSLSRVGEG